MAKRSAGERRKWRKGRGGTIRERNGEEGRNVRVRGGGIGREREREREGKERKGKKMIRKEGMEGKKRRKGEIEKG